MTDWKEYTLGELYNFSSGLSKAREYFGTGYGFVSFKDVFYNYFLPENLTELVQSNEKERKSCSVKRGDVFLTRTSETMHELGKSSVSLRDYEGATFNGFTKRLRPKNPEMIVPEFAGYYFRSPKFRQTVASYAIMTTRASLNNEILDRLTMTLPPPHLQKEIGEILKSLDDKIELNNQINRELEALAQALFKRWFVDFEFPDEKGVPYKSSGGEMVESELGEIPLGWRVLDLGCVSKLVVGGDKPKNVSKNRTEEHKVPIYSNGVTDDGIYGFTDHARIFEESITVSARGTIGFVCLRTQPYVPIVRLISVIPNQKFMSSKYLFMWLKNQIITGNGTTQQQLTVPDFRTSKVIVPQINIVNSFTSVMNSIFENIIPNKNESQELTTLRDILLPKLISGELELSAKVPLENVV